MEYRKLGKSDLNISTLTLGAWEFGSEKQWGKVSEKDTRQVIESAIDKGINIIDTAIVYGDSEIIVGKAIKKLRDKVVIVTKGGADPNKIPDRVNLSLKRLNIDCIDLYLVHYPDKDIPIEDTMEAMMKIKDEGKVRYIGVSNFSTKQLSQAVTKASVVCCESCYNLMWREIEDTGLMDFCYKNNVGILSYSSLGQGFFTGNIRSLDDMPKREGDIRGQVIFFKEDIFKEGMKILEILDKLSRKYNKTVAQISINWVINQKGTTSAIVGMINLEQLNDNLGAVGWKMEEEDYKLLSNKGSLISKRFNYEHSMWGNRYDEVKVDPILDDMGLK
ncbi:MAG: aldo/keto reductase [Candidatus Humimicrobiaceae bacterium]